MTTQSPAQPQIQSPTLSSQGLWEALIKPASSLREYDKPKARLLAGMLIVLFPLALVAAFMTSVTALLEGKTATPPTPGVLLAIVMIPVAYYFSRTSRYSVGAWIALVVPVIAVVVPILSTGVLTSIVSLFFLALSVIMAELLLSSRETLIIGLLVAALTLLLPALPSPTNPQQSQNLSVFSFILVVTGITVMAGRIREGYVRQLEQSQLELRKSLDEEAKARIQAEEARQRAERSEQVKAAFLASMSHELRTPLNSVINFTKFVVKGVMGPVTDRQTETLNKVVDSAKHLLNLINDVLDMSKIESGSLNLFIEDDVDVAALLRGAGETGQVLLGEKPVKLQVDVDSAIPKITGDKQRIRQVMLNIVSNACKFTEQGSITVKAILQSNEVKITVQDTGPGIQPEDAELVFEPFKQTETGLRKGEGTGLGMPISKNLVEAHGGKLWFESTPGQGTTFFVTLPVKSSELVPTVS